MVNKIIVLVGASGSGKTTLGKELEKLGIDKVLSFTTRMPREHEVNGVDYRFIDDLEVDWQHYIKGVVEETEYSGCKYGILRKDMDIALSSGKTVYCICDSNGAKTIKRLYPNQSYIFFLQVDVKIMIDRLRNRGDSPEQILERVYHASVNNELNFDSSVHDYCLTYCNGRTVKPSDDAELVLGMVGTK